MTKHRLANICLGSAICATLSACGTVTRPSDPQHWLASGSVALYRDVKSPAPVMFVPGSLHAFAPSKATTPSGRVPTAPTVRLSLNVKAGTLTLRGIGNTPLLIPVEGADKVVLPESPTVMLKQENPLWYAPDSYFEQRGIPVPHGFAAERFRRGALGPFALFLSGGIPIHTGPLWTSEVGGLRVSEEVGEALFSVLPLGAVIDAE